MIYKITLLILGITLGNKAFNQVTLINLTFSQPPRLTVDAGSDIPSVTGDAITLGDNIIVNGGTPAYSYEWRTTDNNLFQSQTIEVNTIGTYYITVTDADNCTATDSLNVGMTGIVEIKNKKKTFKIFPNPSIKTTNLQLQNLKNPVSIEITSTLGRTIYIEKNLNIPSSYEKKIDLGNAPKGVYYIKVTDDKGFRSVKLFILK
jgi:hypothetical protein